MVEVGGEEQDAVLEELIDRGAIRFDAADYIKTEEDILFYLEACAEEDDGDGRLLRVGLHTIARAQGRNMTHLAQAAGMTREGLYKALSAKGNPSFATLLRIVRALDLQLRIVPTGFESRDDQQ